MAATILFRKVRKKVISHDIEIVENLLEIRAFPGVQKYGELPKEYADSGSRFYLTEDGKGLVVYDDDDDGHVLVAGRIMSRSDADRLVAHCKECGARLGAINRNRNRVIERNEKNLARKWQGEIKVVI